MLLKPDRKAMFPSHSIMVLFCIICFSIGVYGADCKRKASANKVAPEVHRSTRRGAKNMAEITWHFSDEILHDQECYKLQNSKLEMKEGNNAWGMTDYPVEFPGKLIKFTVPVKPCLKYEFRIKLFTENNTHQETTTAVSLPAFDDEKTLAIGYQPENPLDFKASDITQNSAKLTWKKSDCAKSYEIFYIVPGSEDQNKQKSSDKTFVTLSDLKPCTTYEAEIYSILGSREGLSKTQFSTKPGLNIQDRFNVKEKKESTSDAVTLSWDTWQNVTCIEEYKIKTCIENTKCCIKERTINKTVDPSKFHPSVMFKETGLDDKKSYTFRIKPIYKGLDLTVKEHVVRLGQAQVLPKNKDDGAVHFPEKKPSNDCLVAFEFEKPKPPTKQTNGGEKLTIQYLPVAFISLMFNLMNILRK